MKRVSLGIRAHSGWAAYVAMAGTVRSPEIIERGRIGLADPAIPLPFQPFHKAAEMPFRKAEEFIRRATKQTEDLARQGIVKIAADLGAWGMKVTACAVLVGSGRTLGTLAETLAAHPLIHAAEGKLFRDSILHAARRCELRATGVVERELLEGAGQTLGLSQKELSRRMTDFGRAIGPPWQQDQKLAALAAWLEL